MNFCGSILILKIEEKSNIFGLLRFIISKKVKTQLKCKKKKKKNCAMYEVTVTDWMCQKWFAKFHGGDLSLDDAP